MNDPDAIGPDGSVRLRCYLPHASTHYLSAHCAGLGNCGHVAPLGVPAAVRIMGTGDATVGGLARRLRCGRCGSRRVDVVVCSDPRPGLDAEAGRAGAGDDGGRGRAGAVVRAGATGLGGGSWTSG